MHQPALLEMMKDTTREICEGVPLEQTSSASALGGYFDECSTVDYQLGRLTGEGLPARAIMRSLNARKVQTARGSRWHVSSVANLLGCAEARSGTLIAFFRSL
jgi:hypothetical protein